MGKLAEAFFSLKIWFLHSQRILPWRDLPEVYPVWISEIMLQQTQVITVVPYFQRFIQTFPNVDILANAEEDEVLKHWAGLGYYSRARNIHRAAKKIRFELGGEFPSTREGWVAIPGVGQYTAGAILSIAFNQPEAILDGNVERVLSRVRCAGRERGDAVYKSRLWKLSEIFVRRAALLGVEPRILNQALMELGAKICTPKNPKCEECPIRSICRADQRNLTFVYPQRRAPKAWVKVEEKVVCLLNGRGQVLLERRKDSKWRQGLWDLPESLPRSLSSKAKELESVEIRYVVTRHKVTRHAKVLQQASNQWTVAQSDPDCERRWVSLAEPEVPAGSALKKTLKKVSHARQCLAPFLMLGASILGLSLTTEQKSRSTFACPLAPPHKHL